MAIKSRDIGVVQQRKKVIDDKVGEFNEKMRLRKERKNTKKLNEEHLRAIQIAFISKNLRVRKKGPDANAKLLDVFDLMLAKRKSLTNPVNQIINKDLENEVS
jgi:hypothetical protein